MPYQHTEQRRLTCAKSWRKHHPYTPPPSLPNERWLPVVGFERLYEVSSFGRVRRLGGAAGAQPGRILKPWVHRSGYIYVTMCANNKARGFRLGRVVAAAFHGAPPSGKHEVNHKNGRKDDNAAANLEWVTSSENQIHAIATGLQKPKRRHTRSAPTGKLLA